MNYGVGYDRNESFEEALKAKRETIWGGGNLYLELSRYYEFVKSYYDLFDEKNIHVMIFEDWTKNKERTLSKIFDFLGIDTKVVIEHKIKHNVKVGYKNLKILNLLRNQYIKSIIRMRRTGSVAT